MRRRQRGVVMVIALAILAGLVALVASIVASQQIALRAQENRVNAGRARLVAEAGVQRAMASLADTIQAASVASSSTPSSTAQGQAQAQTDEWYTLGNKGGERFTVASGSFRMEIVDAAGLVNLNTAPLEQLNLLPLRTEQVSAILDWREAATTSTRVDGAKDSYYNALTKPYNAALRRFDDVSELLAVRYFTPADVWQVTDNSTSSQALPALADGRQPVLADLLTTDSSSSLNTPSGTAPINVSNQPKQTVVQRLTGVGVSQQIAAQIADSTPQNQGGNSPTFADLGAVLQRVPSASTTDLGLILDNATTSAATVAQGRINLNTASEAVLMSLPNMTQDLAQGIVNYQSTGFTKLSDLLQVSGFSSATTLQNFAKYFTVRSSVFLVHVVGEFNGASVALEAVVDTSSGTPRLLKMNDQPFSDMPTRWGWTDQTTTDISLVDAQ